MQRVILSGIVLACITAVSFLRVFSVERKPLIPEATVSTAAAPRPSQVEVTNFPAVQAVSGTVIVSNLPVDGEGRLIVAVPQAAPLRFIGYSTATFPEGTGLLDLNRACAAEFPATRTCSALEIVQLIPAPGPTTAPALLVSFVGTRDLGGVGPVEIPASSCMSASGVAFSCGTGPLPVACCGR